MVVAPLSETTMGRVREAYLSRVRSLANPASSENTAAFEGMAGCHVTGKFQMELLKNKVRDRESARQALPARVPLSINMPASRFKSPMLLRGSTWDAPTSLFVDLFNSLEVPANPKLGWTRSSNVVAPKNTNQPLFDFFEVMWYKPKDDAQPIKVPVVYQMTAITEHPMTRNALVELLDELECTPDAPLVWCLPCPRLCLSGGRFSTSSSASSRSSSTRSSRPNYRQSRATKTKKSTSEC